MNWIILGISAVAGVALTSCGGVGGGQTVDEPTTEQMNQLEQQWGLPARKAHSHNTFAPPSDTPSTSGPSAPVQAEPAPPPAPAPASLDPEPPRLDAGTIKKLQ